MDIFVAHIVIHSIEIQHHELWVGGPERPDQNAARGDGGADIPYKCGCLDAIPRSTFVLRHYPKRRGGRGGARTLSETATSYSVLSEYNVDEQSRDLGGWLLFTSHHLTRPLWSSSSCIRHWFYYSQPASTGTLARLQQPERLDQSRTLLPPASQLTKQSLTDLREPSCECGGDHPVLSLPGPVSPPETLVGKKTKVILGSPTLSLLLAHALRQSRRELAAGLRKAIPNIPLPAQHSGTDQVSLARLQGSSRGRWVDPLAFGSGARYCMYSTYCTYRVPTWLRTYTPRLSPSIGTPHPPFAPGTHIFLILCLIRPAPTLP